MANHCCITEQMLNGMASGFKVFLGTGEARKNRRRVRFMISRLVTEIAFVLNSRTLISIFSSQLVLDDSLYYKISNAVKFCLFGSSFRLFTTLTIETTCFPDIHDGMIPLNCDSRAVAFPCSV